MGANASKQEVNGQYEWKASGPPSVSVEVLDSLKSSPEVWNINFLILPPNLLPNRPQTTTYNADHPLTNTTSQTDASRARLIEQHVQARVAEELKKLQKKESEALKAAHEKISSSEHNDENKLSSFSLGKEVDELRRKLEERKKVRELPESVETARGAVIRCLREHDRRPLDCWQEVEDFKAEVKKLEKSWVDKITS
ncbi:DUF1690 domain-containing protein [Metarhizium acridum CQMa 102]|uniref:DUF1690 domain-containing protein n=1 Tax=Metarhizium acridum (strain CQMa 102) TaxID=655827 RepID=E9E894_METAQ|nr:DUF1690 domain-containing protein [Metarhizium acridum CQMa 102]EFY87844.1 DUF1690 domain-containing protein [Metarhizium acridum CQMa 102]